MGLTKFPSGVSSFGIPQLGGGGIPATTGNVFFVDSGATGAADGNAGTSPTKPCATIDGAVNKCTANNGDQIIVMPGHIQNETGSGFLAMDVAGVSVFGLGQGDSRPQLIYDNAAASVIVSASNCRISNIIFMASVADVLAGVIVNNATTNTEIDNCKWSFDATGLEFKHMLELGGGGTSAAGDQVIVRNCWFRAENVTGADSAIKLDDCFDIHILNNMFTGFWKSVCLDGAADSSAVKDYIIVGNIIENKDTASPCIVDLDDAATGIIAYNGMASNDAAVADSVDFGALHCIENFVTDIAADVTAVEIPEATAA